MGKKQVPGARLVVTLLHDQEYLMLMSRGQKGCAAAWVFTALIVAAKEQRNGGTFKCNLAAVARMTGISQRTILSAINLITAICIESGSVPWIQPRVKPDSKPFDSRLTLVPLSFDSGLVLRNYRRYNDLARPIIGPPDPDPDTDTEILDTRSPYAKTILSASDDLIGGGLIGQDFNYPVQTDSDRAAARIVEAFERHRPLTQHLSWAAVGTGTPGRSTLDQAIGRWGIDAVATDIDQVFAGPTNVRSLNYFLSKWGSGLTRGDARPSGPTPGRRRNETLAERERRLEREAAPAIAAAKAKSDAEVAARKLRGEWGEDYLRSRQRRNGTQPVEDSIVADLAATMLKRGKK